MVVEESQDQFGRVGGRVAIKPLMGVTAIALLFWLLLMELEPVITNAQNVG